MAIQMGAHGAQNWEILTKVERDDRLLGMSEAETGRNFERGVTSDFKVLGLSNWKDEVAMY